MVCKLFLLSLQIMNSGSGPAQIMLIVWPIILFHKFSKFFPIIPFEIPIILSIIPKICTALRHKPCGEAHACAHITDGRYRGVQHKVKNGSAASSYIATVLPSALIIIFLLTMPQLGHVVSQLLLVQFTSGQIRGAIIIQV